MCKTVSNILYVQDLIIYIIECDLDFLTDKVISKILKVVNGTIYFTENLLVEIPITNLCNVVINSCDIKRYLKYLQTYESKELTIWCDNRRHVNNGIYIWIRQLPIIAKFSHDVEIFKIIFDMIFTLIKNCEEVYWSPRSICFICEIVIEYGNCFDNYEDLYQTIWNTKIHLLLKNKMNDHFLKPSIDLKMCMEKINLVHKRKRIISTIFSIEKASRNFPKDLIRHICLNYDDSF
jgi:hypothetical protein